MNNNFYEIPQDWYNEFGNTFMPNMNNNNDLSDPKEGFLRGNLFNNLYDPYKKRPIILINKDIIKNYNPRCLLVPCKTINKEGIIKCFRVKKIIINGKKREAEVLVSISDNNFNIDGVDLLLHSKIIERMNHE